MSEKGNKIEITTHDGLAQVASDLGYSNIDSLVVRYLQASGGSWADRNAAQKFTNDVEQKLKKMNMYDEFSTYVDSWRNKNELARKKFEKKVTGESEALGIDGEEVTRAVAKIENNYWKKDHDLTARDDEVTTGLMIDAAKWGVMARQKALEANTFRELAKIDGLTGLHNAKCI